MQSVRDIAREIRLDKASPTPIYAQIVEGMVRYLVRSGMAGGERLPAEVSFAEALGVSRGTVRQAYALLREQGVAEPSDGNGRLVVSSRLTEKRLETLPRCVGIVLLQPLSVPVGNAAWRTLDYLAGAVDASSAAGYSVTFLTLPEESASLDEQIRWHNHVCATVAGVIHFGVRRVGHRLHLAQQRLFEDARLPQVFISARSRSPRIASVHADYRAGYLPAVEHLCHLGHRRIASIAGPPPPHKNEAFIPSSTYRGDGMKWALHQCGLRVRSDWAATHCLTQEEIAKAAKRIMNSRPRPTAFLCQNDDVAVSLIEHLRHARLSVPKDVSVVGYDDTVLAKRCDPPLTTIHQPRRAIGTRCFQLIAKCREQGTVFDNVEEILPAGLVVRASTGPVPEQNAPEKA